MFTLSGQHRRILFSQEPCIVLVLLSFMSRMRRKTFLFRLDYEVMKTSYSLSQPGNVNSIATMNSAHSSQTATFPERPSHDQTDWSTKVHHSLAFARSVWPYMVCYANRSVINALSSLYNTLLRLLKENLFGTFTRLVDTIRDCCVFRMITYLH